jgi:hypothetical protein
VRHDVLVVGFVCSVMSASLRIGDLDGDGWPEARLDVAASDAAILAEDTARGEQVVIVDVASFVPELDEVLDSYEGNDYAYESDTRRLALRDADGDGRRDAELVGRHESFDSEADETRPERTPIHEVRAYDPEADAFTPWVPPPAPAAPAP